MRPQTVGSVVRGVEAGHHREQHLRGADVAGRLLPPDVLLTRLQREPQRRSARRRRPTRRRGVPAWMRLCASRVAKNAACGPPKPSGTPKRCDEPTTTSAPISPGGVQQDQREQVARDARRARPARGAARSPGAGRAPRRCSPGTGAAPRTRPASAMPAPGSPTTTSIPIGSARVRTTSIVCGWQSASTKNVVARVRVQPVAHRHRLAGRGRLVEQGRVGDVHAGEVAHHRLEVEQRLEPSLRDLGLVRRVRGVPGRVLQHVAQDDGRRDRVRVAHADERGEDVVALGELAERVERLGLARAPAGASGSRVRMLSGTARSTSSSSDDRPSASSMRACSPASGPTWRPTKRSGASRSVRECSGAIGSSGSSFGVYPRRAGLRWPPPSWPFPALSRNLRDSPGPYGPGFPRR